MSWRDVWSIGIYTFGIIYVVFHLFTTDLAFMEWSMPFLCGFIFAISLVGLTQMALEEIL